ncbi:LapA family protein [Pseudopelagicola sp. nBUS_19]|uniref:LapA family protein n=1 Tax=Pseudopelagicola sp. nBUS_19 TaxID=3395316 RepID=UPI003EB6D5A7
MRYIRYAFLGVLAVVLISMALANREMVILKLLPAPLDELVGINYAMTLPMFVVIFAAIASGLLIGFCWEWMREHKHRSGKSVAERELDNIKREMRRLKGRQSGDKDEVLALLDEAG